MPPRTSIPRRRTWGRWVQRPIPSKEEAPTIVSYAEGLLKIAMKAYETISYTEDMDLAMAEARLNLKYRVPDKQRLEWARSIVEAMGDRPPKNVTEVYAREQIFLHGSDAESMKPVAGRTTIERWHWYHVVFVRNGDHVLVYVGGNPQPEIDTRSPAGFPVGFDRLFFGGRCDNDSNWEGRLDEIAVFDRPLSAEQVQALSVAGRSVDDE